MRGDWTQSEDTHKAAAMLVEVCLWGMLLFFLRSSVFYAFNQHADLPQEYFFYFFKFSTFIAIVVTCLLWIIYVSPIWRIDIEHALFLGCWVVFSCISLLQGSARGAALSFQVFGLPIFMSGFSLLRRSAVKAMLTVIALLGAMFMIGEFLALNNHWLGLLSPHSEVVGFFSDYRAALGTNVSDMPVLHAETSFGMLGEVSIVRPYGINLYLLISGIALAMLCAFFILESFIFGKFFDYCLSALLFIALVLTTSTTSIFSFFASIIFLVVLLKSRIRVLFHGLWRRKVLAGFVIAGGMIIVAPILLALVLRVWWSMKFGESFAGVHYLHSFVPTLNSIEAWGRFFIGGNFWELTLSSTQTGWEYDGMTRLVREGNFLNFIALFGVVPMGVVFWRWIRPFARLLNTENYYTDPRAIPFMGAFLAGIFSTVHDHGIINWENTFFFYLYYVCVEKWQRPQVLSRL